MPADFNKRHEVCPLAHFNITCVLEYKQLTLQSDHPPPPLSQMLLLE